MPKQKRLSNTMKQDTYLVPHKVSKTQFGVKKKKVAIHLARPHPRKKTKKTNFVPKEAIKKKYIPKTLFYDSSNDYFTQNHNKLFGLSVGSVYSIIISKQEFLLYFPLTSNSLGYFEAELS